MINIQHLTAGYPDRTILQDLNLTIENGRITILLGPNGCGKSTLIKSCAGLIPRLGGDILVDGIPFDTLSQRALAQHISYMAQTRNTPSIVARKMVLHGRFPYLSYPRHYSRTDLQIAEDALKAVDAADLANSNMSELSGGQRQKIYLAMTLAQNTGNLLMDEPMNFLDIQHQLNLLALARQLASQGKAVLLVMHDLRLAMQTDQASLVVMNHGQIAAQGSAEEIYHSGILDDIFSIHLQRISSPSGMVYYYR